MMGEPMGLAIRHIVLRRTRAITMITLVAGAVLLSAVPADAHADYHHQQQQGLYRKKGIWWQSEVTNPSVPVFDPVNDESPEHFVAPAWLDEPQTTNSCASGTNKWLELGWAERGDRLIPLTGQPERFIYAFDSGSCEWDPAGVRLDVGEVVQFAMTPAATCVDGVGQCVWLMQFMRDDGLGWQTFTTTTMWVGNDLVPKLGTEEQTKAGGVHWQIAGSDAGFNIDVYFANLRHGDGTWWEWVPAELTSYSSSTPSTAPYAINYGTQWKRFWTRRTF